MSDQHFKKIMVGLAFAAILLLTFCVGLLLMRSHTAPPLAQGVDVPEAVTAVPDSKPVANPPLDPPVDSQWRFDENGCKVTQNGTQFRITGATDHDGWVNNTNGVITAMDYPEGNFTISADFMVPKFIGSGYRQIFLRANSAEGHKVALYYQVGAAYMLQLWPAPAVKPRSVVSMIGDEAINFHRLKLDYNSATQTATGWVDDHLAGSATVSLSGRLTFEMTAGTDKSGMNIDVLFDHFTLVRNQ